MRARVTEKAALIINYQIMVSWTGNFVGNEMIHFALKRTKKFYKCSFVIVKTKFSYQDYSTLHC